MSEDVYDDDAGEDDRPVLSGSAPSQLSGLPDAKAGDGDWDKVETMWKSAAQADLASVFDAVSAVAGWGDIVGKEGGMAGWSCRCRLP